MRKTAAVFMTVIGILGGLAIGSIPAISQPGGRTTIVAYDLNRDDRSVDVDENRKYFSAGDTFMFSSRLLDPADKETRIGSLKVICEVLAANREKEAATQLCEGEATFEAGKLTAFGSLRFGPNSDSAQLVITGGTGEYEGAAGTLTVEFERRAATLTFDFTT